MSLPAHLPEIHPNIFLIGLAPRSGFLIETDDEEMSEASTDSAGTLELKFPPKLHARILIHQDPFHHDPE